MRQIPCRSSRAVRTRSTDESGSSVHSTGVSEMHTPSRSAVTISSVSKNQSSSSTSGRICSARSRRMALNPHWKSETWLRSDSRTMWL